MESSLSNLESYTMAIYAVLVTMHARRSSGPVGRTGPRHRISANRRPYHRIRSASWRVSLSSVRSATTRFSLRFSSLT